jgi:hypothetical protein
MDGVILIAVVWLALAGIANLFGYNPGTKGLSEKPYISKSGKKELQENKERNIYYEQVVNLFKRQLSLLRQSKV